jgi:hypothetical protein
MSVNLKFMCYCYTRNEKCSEWSNKGKGLGSRGGKGSRGPNQKAQSTNEVGIEEIELRLPLNETALGGSMDGIKKSYKKTVDTGDDKESSKVEDKALGVSKLSSSLSSGSIDLSQGNSNSKRKSAKIVNYADLQAYLQARDNGMAGTDTSNERVINTSKETVSDTSNKIVSDASNDNDHMKVGNYWNNQYSSNKDIKHDIHDNNDNDYNSYHDNDNKSQKISLRSILKRVSFSESSQVSSQV